MLNGIPGGAGGRKWSEASLTVSGGGDGSESLRVTGKGVRIRGA
jgi:hypothetical protein